MFSYVFNLKVSVRFFSLTYNWFWWSAGGNLPIFFLTPKTLTHVKMFFCFLWVLRQSNVPYVSVGENSLENKIKEKNSTMNPALSDKNSTNTEILYKEEENSNKQNIKKEKNYSKTKKNQSGRHRQTYQIFKTNVNFSYEQNFHVLMVEEKRTICHGFCCVCCFRHAPNVSLFFKKLQTNLIDLFNHWIFQIIYSFILCINAILTFLYGVVTIM